MRDVERITSAWKRSRTHRPPRQLIRTVLLLSPFFWGCGGERGRSMELWTGYFQMTRFTVKSSLLIERLDELRPTQICVGFKEVKQKRKEYAALKPKQREALMRQQLFPVVKGLHGKYFILDHHHAAMAMLQEGAVEIQAGLVEDLSHLSAHAFWTYLDHFSWMHVYDQTGRKCGFSDIPERFADLVDDPYRSFAGAVREAGGFSKPLEPFQEFLWANFFRDHVTPKAMKRSWIKAVSAALKLAHSKEAQHLPGWCGPK
jgi:hypothetical protein